METEEVIGPDGKKKRVRNRFNGISEEELAKRLLPDVIEKELDILMVSLN